MRQYTGLPGRPVRQPLANLLAVGWLAGWCWLAYQARELVPRVRVPASGPALATPRPRRLGPRSR